MRVGFIGLGRMGRPMSQSLAQAGHELVLFDANARAAEELAAVYKGSVATDCAAITERCEIVILSLPGPEESAAVVLDILATAAPGFLIIDMTTNTLEHSRDIARRAAESQVGYLDAPVSRGGGEGALSIMVGGSDAAFERARPLLEAIAATVCHAGASGAGTAMKLVNQAIYVTYMAAFAEGLMLAEEFGVPLEAALTCLGTAAAGDPLMTTKYDELLGRSNKNFAIASAVRYLDYTEAAFGSLASAKPIISAAAVSLRGAVSAGAGNGDLVVTRHRYVARQGKPS